MSKGKCTSKNGKLIQIGEEQVWDHLSEITRGTVEDTLCAILDAEAACFSTQGVMNERKKEPKEPGKKSETGIREIS